MPRYTYTAKSEPGKTAEGFIEAESEHDAVNKLAGMGLFPISVRYETQLLNRQSAFGAGIKRKEIVLFTRQLSTLIESGVDVLQALRIISEQAGHRSLGVVIADISSKIKDGKSLSESMASFGNLFSGLYCSLVRAGEASGDLSTSLRRLADFLESEEEFKDTLKSNLTYPAFVFAVSAATVAVLLLFVVPRLVTMFEDMGQVLPLPTRMLISFSSFLGAWWWLVAAVCAAAVFFCVRLYQSPKGRNTFDDISLKVFLLGPIILKSEISRMMRTLSLLLSSGQPITGSLEICAAVLDNQVLRAEVRAFRDKVISGASLSQAMKGSRHFPEFVTNIVAIGEETGSLDKSLLRIAADYERECDRTVKDMMRLLEPVIILVMGLVVGFIVISMLLPIFQINLIVR